MDHELSTTLLSDLLAGRLPADRAAAAWTHVGSCPECQGIASTMHRVRAAVGGESAEAAAAHPASEDLVAFALGDGDVALADLARLRLHVESCPECREAVALTRAAEAGTKGPDWNGAIERLGGFFHAPRLVPALAVLAVLLAYPAWIGLVRYPAAFEEQQRSCRALASIEERERSLRQELAHRGTTAPAWGGGVPLLFLRASSRGAGAPARIAVDTEAPAVPVALEYDLGPLATASPGAEVRIAIDPVAGSSPGWERVERADRVWDPVNRLVVLLVPAAALSPGEHRLELRIPGRPEPAFASRFRVERSHR